DAGHPRGYAARPSWRRGAPGAGPGQCGEPGRAVRAAVAARPGGRVRPGGARRRLLSALHHPGAGTGGRRANPCSGAARYELPVLPLLRQEVQRPVTSGLGDVSWQPRLTLLVRAPKIISVRT